ncbi:c-type cytochrome [Ramlibacter tataouinensis]|uniref:Candidate Cytochrome c-type protein n=1 Tax=Ramlibacter tataouinensis (strain ATCC BAA-407 / DSM 14655 / LMG 21543 / TTB310) TaxID=365046 RepID=F5XWU4_RAMTT|nr:c-type cytochrome [Ramlibacter tataouinensis]AEG91705.1 Candidate Cytochrome c-type protein [Ramlibacter tataouinensis TTB310]
MNASHLLATGVLAALLQAAHAQLVVPSGKTTEQAQRPATAQHCAACHGESGEGRDGAPRIAGQSAPYIEKQLRSYANGSRRNPVMEAMAKAMSAQDMASFAAYYSRLDAPAATGVAATAGTAAAVERGRVLATQGDSVRQVPACINCHGPGGVGEPPAIPYLAGLDHGYLVAAMNAWKEGTRKNDAGQQMATTVKGMTADDVVAVAQYFSGLQPPKPAPQPLVSRPVRAGDAARGHAIVASGAHGCTACHAIPGIRGPIGIVGPPLGGLAGRSFLAGQLPNNTEVLVTFLQDPAALVPRTGMPDVGLNNQEARDIAAFLYTLEPPRAR